MGFVVQINLRLPRLLYEPEKSGTSSYTARDSKIGFWLRRLGSIFWVFMRQFGYTIFLPQEQEFRELTSECIFSVDVGGVDNARVVVAILDGPDPDSGTSWECGYAFAKGKSIIAVRTDFRSADDGDLAPLNLMLWESAIERVQAPCLQYNLELLTDEIHRALQSVIRQP